MARRAWRRGAGLIKRIRDRRRAPLVGQFQPYNHTLPNRYPWLFRFAADALAGREDLRILSFGCSTGEEVAALTAYFPDAAIKGLDIDAGNIARCRARGWGSSENRVRFAAAGDTHAEASNAYDAIFCLAVLCHGDLTHSGATRCDPSITFAAFESQVTDFARSLKPGGLLLLHTSSFRFRDTDIANSFDVVCQADPSQLSADVLFDRENKLMPGVRYRDVGFRKRPGSAV